MMMGIQGPNGFTSGAAEQGLKFANPAYTSYRLHREKQKDGNGPLTPSAHFAKIKAFKQEHPDVFCEEHTSEKIVCFSIQTHWMRSQALGNLSFDDPVNGLLSDASHKYWKSPDEKLIVTTIFSPLMLRWVPVLFTYSDGTTADHYKFHFLILIRSIAEEAKAQNVALNDKLLAMVCILLCNWSHVLRYLYHHFYCL